MRMEAKEDQTVKSATVSNIKIYRDEVDANAYASLRDNPHSTVEEDPHYGEYVELFTVSSHSPLVSLKEGLSEEEEYDQQYYAAKMIESALIGFEDIYELALRMDMDEVYPLDSDEMNHPDVPSKWLASIVDTGLTPYEGSHNGTNSNIDRGNLIKKHAMGMVVSLQAMYKMGLNFEQIMRLADAIDRSSTGEETNLDEEIAHIAGEIDDRD